MGVSLTYQTTAPVPVEVKKAILAETKRINRERVWWCESIIFFDPVRGKKKGPAPLTGDTKFSLSYYSDGEGGGVEVDDDDDLFMGHRDMAFIIQQLVKWSHEHGLIWQLDVAGGEIGTITNGEVQPRGLFDWDKSETVADRKRAEQLDRKYASRN